MAETSKILVVDDDLQILMLLRAHLESEGYQIYTAADGHHALSVIEQENPDLLLLDIMMPTVDGLQICEQVREFSEVPIIIVSALGHEEQKVKALDLGADDYLTKPFGKEELKARVRAALRRARSGKQGSQEAVLERGDFKIDFLHRRVSVNEEPVQLTPIQYGLLRELAKEPDKVIGHRELLSQVWGPQYVDSVNYLHLHIGRLRKRLSGSKDVQILTQSGVGYMLQTTQ